MPHRFNKLPPISLGPRPCGCFPGEVLCVSMAAARRHPSLTVWTTRVSNTDRAPYSRSSASNVDGRLPWPLVVRTPSPNFTSQACPPPTPPRCQQEAGGGTCPPHAVTPTPLRGLAALYAQSRPAMLSRRCLTATAGTSLVRDSQGGGASCGRPGWCRGTAPNAQALVQTFVQ